MRKIVCPLCLLLVTVASCTTKSKARGEAQKAFLAGQQQGLRRAQEFQRIAVRVMGNVKNPLVEWTSSLTLAEAIIAADYLGSKNPSDILIIRQGQVLHFDPRRLLNGEDMPLLPGDTLEIRP